MLVGRKNVMERSDSRVFLVVLEASFCFRCAPKSVPVPYVPPKGCQCAAKPCDGCLVKGAPPLHFCSSHSRRRIREQFKAYFTWLWVFSIFALTASEPAGADPAAEGDKTSSKGKSKG